VVWTRLHAVETEVAIEIANLARLIQSKLTAPLDRHQMRRRLAHATDAILCRTLRARIVIANSDFEWRDRRGNEVELSDRANEFTERRVFEYRIDHDCPCEVRNDQPGSPPWRRPQVEPLVDKQHRDKQSDREPFVSQPAWPVSHRVNELAHEVSHKHERACEAKEISSEQEDEYKGAAKVYPRECRSEVLRRELWTEEPVQNHGRADYEERDLKQRARVALLEQAADDGNAQQIEWTTTQVGATPLISNWRSTFEPSGKVR